MLNYYLLMCVNVNVVNESIGRKTGSVSIPTQGITWANFPSVHDEFGS